MKEDVRVSESVDLLDMRLHCVFYVQLSTISPFWFHNNVGADLLCLASAKRPWPKIQLGSFIARGLSRIESP
jgi:hypothetical protein